MRVNSSVGTTAPVGLLGELTISIRDFGLSAASTCAARRQKPSAASVGTETGRRTAYLTVSGPLTQQGAGTSTSSPATIRALMASTMTCLPPTFTVHPGGRGRGPTCAE